MDKIINYYEDVALSDKDILNMLEGRVNIVLYPDLYKYSNLDQILGQYGACILLFEAKPNYGHWVCLFKQSYEEVCFFNPYGGFPDDSLLHINKSFRKESHQLKPLLTNFLINSRYKLTYNEFDFQRKAPEIKTCGRHCVVRLLNRDLDLYEYKKYLDLMCKKLNTDYDGVVTYLTI